MVHVRTKVTSLLISSLILLCSCNDNNISSDTSSDASYSSVSENAEKSYAIHHEKVVSEGMSLSELCEKGILPDLSSYGIRYESFPYKETLRSSFTTRNNYGGSSESVPTDMIYRYFHETDDSYNYNQRCWNECIEIDEEGRIVNIENVLTDNRREKYVKHIPEEDILSKDELLTAADKLWKIIAENGKVSPDEYTQKVSYWDDGSIRINYTKDIVKDVIWDVCSVTLFPNGEVDRVYVNYSDIKTGYSLESFDSVIDKLIEDYNARVYAGENYKLEIHHDQNEFIAIDGTIYGAYTYTIAFYDDEYPDEPSYGCYSVYFEEP